MKEIKYPVSIYDEPAEYKTFSGGMNTSRNELAILINQMKYCENMHYINGSLHVRKGGKTFIEFITPEELNNVQGIFMFSIKSFYIIVANNGKLFYGRYNGAYSKIALISLPINIVEDPLSTGVTSSGLLQYDVGSEPQQAHDGYIQNNASNYSRLIFQNKFKIEGLQHKNKIYITTGTRFIEISETYNGQLLASIVEPYLPTAIEYNNIGPNLLSHVPSLHIQTKGVGVKTAINAVIPTKQQGGSIKLKAVMTYGNGESPNDYRFKWEESRDGITFTPHQFISNGQTVMSSLFKNTSSIGEDSIIVSAEDATMKKYRCSFAKSFKVSYDPTKEEGKKYDWQYENGDYVVDKVDGYWYGQAQSIPYNEQLYIAPNSDYMKIQTCKKIFGYGNKFILYDDAYNSGNFYKTIIDNPNYITYRNGLNFKTDKDEQLIRLINFKGVIVAFAYNKMLGGNISIVSGNGDDYNDSSSNYSPFSRRIINKEITTDNADTVQVADNIIIFKYKTSVYSIEGSELNYEIVTIQEINTHVKQANKYVTIPFDSNDCFSEKNEDYYALIWREKYSLDGELIQPAYRVKFYYKSVFQDGGIIYFPVLVDTSELFNAELIMHVDNKPLYYYQNKLITFSDDHYKDFDKQYKVKFVSKGFELNYPQFIKSIKSLVFSYACESQSNLKWNVKIYNEALFEILKDAKKEINNNTFSNLNAIIKLDSLLVSYILITPKLREDCMAATIDFEGTIDKDFVISSFTFYYITKSLPKMSPIDKYKKIIRKGERLIK